MDDVGAAAFAAAQAMVGVRFRLQGRDGQHGLDCVGLVWAAYQAVGVRLRAADDYPIRGWSAARIVAAMDACGLKRCDEESQQIGDAALIALPAGQFHLGIMGAAHVVHAHAGLRRVVLTPLHGEWLQAMRWRWVGCVG